jgi:oligopeptide transport system ATP-binding protein
MTDGDALLSVQELKVHFPIKGGIIAGSLGHVRAVDGVSFDLKPGETLGIVGESGCGKSTLGRAVLRLIDATEGRVVWAGRDLFGLDDKTMRGQRRQMQIIFQDPLASLDPRLSVETIIGKPLKTFHPELSRAEVRKRVLETMGQVGLSPAMASPISSLGLSEA